MTGTIHHDRGVAREAEPVPQPSPEPSALARHSDPSLRSETSRPAISGAKQGGVEWVRASDLLARGGMSVGGRGITAQENVVRRMRAGMASITARRAQAGQAPAPLPPVSAFGQTMMTSGQAVTR